MVRRVITVLSIMLFLGSLATMTADSVTGTLRSLTAEKVIIEAEGGRSMTFLVTEDTTMAHGLKVGDRVMVEYHTGKTGSAVADRITLVRKNRPSEHPLRQ